MKSARSAPHLSGPEQERLFALQSTRLLASGRSEGFDRITRLAAKVFQTPIALITLIDRDCQWFKSSVGIETRQTRREDAFCRITILGTDVFVVPDAALDPRFRDNPLVTGEPHIRFYAGAPLVLPSGHALGSLCVIDHVPRQFSAEQRAQLKDMAALVLNEIQLQRSAGRIDEITLLPNRAQLGQDLADLCVLSPGAQRTLVLVELLTHQAVQDAVRAVGVGPVEQLVRDVAVRLGGLLDSRITLYAVAVARLAFVLEEADPEHQAGEVDALVTALRQPFFTSGISVELAVHAGLVRFELTPASAGDALRKSTAALYQATESQQLSVIYEPQADARYRRSYRLLREIPGALARGELRLVYQPKLDVATARFLSAEALVRWQHPQLGNVSPAEFIPLVEGTAFIHQLTEWVLHVALAQVAAWHASGLDVAVAVNVSARNLEHPDFLRTLRNALALYDVAPASLHVECTEYAAITGRSSLEALARVRAMGVQVALDDFGAGFSNLSCLHNLPAEILKIDRALVAPSTEPGRAAELLELVVLLGHRMGYRMLAEGVETADVFARLVAIGCDGAQGYYLARPMEAEAAAAALREGPAPAVREAIRAGMLSRASQAPATPPRAS